MTQTEPALSAELTAHSIDGTPLPAVDVNEIMGMIPHRYPFLMIDRVDDIDLEANRAIGVKCVTINEPFFLGHFPGHPVMPGVLIVEAMAQTAATFVVYKLGTRARGKIVYFMTIDKARFRAPVQPGSLLK
ncbi:MAG: 3-hydroxyacyl-ACP dehydratase FabZ, partial [Pseudomonadota bacterium]